MQLLTLIICLKLNLGLLDEKFFKQGAFVMNMQNIYIRNVETEKSEKNVSFTVKDEKIGYVQFSKYKI